MQAVEEIGRTHGVALVALSSLFETEPVGFESRNLFLNGVLAVEVSDEIPPSQLMDRLLDIEQGLGRDRSAGMDRTIDLDLLFMEGISLDEPGPPQLTLPHPHIAERAFVLAPWAEIAPEIAPFPDLGNIAELLKKHPDTQGGLERRTHPVLYRSHPKIAL
jgi:2-amino-4-hydroxy-6-hydroxymethyldihydropteridine diphosphokinase